MGGGPGGVIARPNAGRGEIMSVETASAPTDDGQWTFLEDTYWYVPVPYLPAAILVNTDPAQTAWVVDQTLWHITRVENGYVFGTVAANLGTGWSYSTLVGSITPDGYLTLSDRTKDIIKSGGEWISSVDLENAVMGHPAVAEAAVIGIPDE